MNKENLNLPHSNKMSSKAIRGLIRANSSNPIISLIAGFCEKFLRAYYNEDFYDLAKNGEKQVIEKASEYFADSLFVLDIGANRGWWSYAVLQKRPDAKIMCFEIIPATAKALTEKLSSYPGVTVCGFGLSSESKELDVYWNKVSDDTSAISPRHADPLFANADTEKIVCRVEKGDAVLERQNFPRIDLMKIDVEGHEVNVLQGFERTLGHQTARPSIIQFEYGATYLPQNHNLCEVYALLEPLGYTIGRVYPDGVRFKRYEFSDDHFRMGNYVAVQAGSELEKRLCKF